MHQHFYTNFSNLIEILKIIYKMSLQRTPPKATGNSGRDETFKDLSGTINVPKPIERQNISKTGTIEKNKGVYKGTRSNTTSDNRPIPPPPPPPTSLALPKNPLPPIGATGDTGATIQATKQNEEVEFLNLNIAPNIDIQPSDMYSSRKDNLNISNLSSSSNQLANISGQNFRFSSAHNNLHKVLRSGEPNNNSVPMSPEYRDLLEDLISAVQEANKEQLAKEIDRRVKDNVKELLKDHILIPKSQHQSNPSTQNRQSVESRPVSEFVREFRQRLTLGDNRSQSNNANRQQQQSHSEAYPIFTERNNPGTFDRNYSDQYEERGGDYHQNTNVSRDYYDRKPVRIDQWDLKFDGRRNGAITVEEFVFRIEYLQVHYNCPWKIIIRDFHTLLRENAKEWYWMYIRYNRNAEWEDLREALLLQYQSTTSDLDVIRDIVERRQQPNETVDAYFHELSKLRSKLDKSYPEISLIRIIKRNLRDGISRIVYPMSIYSIDQLRHECFQIEQNFPRRDRMPTTQLGRFQGNRIAQVHEIEEQGEEEYVQVDEARFVRPNKNTGTGSKIICYNCRQPGHIFMNCPEDPKIFCYRCGLPEFKTINCPDCKKGNGVKTATTPGESRSTQPALEMKPHQNLDNPFR